MTLSGLRAASAMSRASSTTRVFRSAGKAQPTIRRGQASGVRRHGTRDAPRIRAELQADNVPIARKRVARLMRSAGIAGVSRRKRPPITTKQAPDHRPASDLVRRNFIAEGSDELWVVDTTFIPTLVGLPYLAVVLGTPRNMNSLVSTKPGRLQTTLCSTSRSWPRD